LQSPPLGRKGRRKEGRSLSDRRRFTGVEKKESRGGQYRYTPLNLLLSGEKEGKKGKKGGGKGRGLFTSLRHSVHHRERSRYYTLLHAVLGCVIPLEEWGGKGGGKGAPCILLSRRKKAKSKSSRVSPDGFLGGKGSLSTFCKAYF